MDISGENNALNQINPCKQYWKIVTNNLRILTETHAVIRVFGFFMADLRPSVISQIQLTEEVNVNHSQFVSVV